MLAAPGDTVASAMPTEGATASVEQKLDGARIQAHRSGPEVRLFTRNGNDVTSRLGAVVELMTALPCDSVVLDGEVIALAADERPEAFQDTMARFGRHTDEEGARASSRLDASSPAVSSGFDAAAAVLPPLGVTAGALTVRFFDCIHLDGVDLLDEPLRTRAQALVEVAAGWVVPSVQTADPAEAEAFLATSLAAGHEGVVVKDLGSPYEAGRRGGAWRKVKPVRTSTCSWWPSSGGAAGAGAGSPTSTSPPATPTAARRSWWARPSRA